MYMKSLAVFASTVLVAMVSFQSVAGAAESHVSETARQAAIQNDPVLAAILAKADAPKQSTAATVPVAPAIAATAIVGDWQLVKVEQAEVPYLYVDSTLHFAADGTVTLRQQLKNRDRKDDWQAVVEQAQDAAGAWHFVPTDEKLTVRSYEQRPVPKTDLEDQIAPWLFRYDEANRYHNRETHERTIHREYTVRDLTGDTLTGALVYSDDDGCEPRTVTLTYARGLHVVTAADRAAQYAIDNPPQK